MKIRFALWLILASMPASASAQEAVVPGERVRIETRGRVAGTLMRASADSLVLIPDGVDLPVAIARGDMTGLERSVGRKSRGTGFLAGVGIGAAAGLVLALATAPSDEDDCPSGDVGCEFVDEFVDEIFAEPATDLLLIVAPLTFGLLGGGVGALVNGGEKWESVPLTAAITAGPDGRVGVRFSLR